MDMELMERIYVFAEDFYFAHYRTPSMAEIAEEMGIARPTAYKYVTEMRENGMIDYDGETIVTEKMRMLSQDTCSQVFDRAIPCGGLEEIDAAVAEYVHLPVSLFGEGDLFVLRTTGDSMIEAGIEAGDAVVIRRQQTARVGDIVAALGDETSSSLKRLLYDKETGEYILHPENESMEDIRVKSLEIQGVAKFVIKAL